MSSENVCGCKEKMWDGVIYFCPMCGGQLEDLTCFTVFGRNVTELKKIIDFAIQHGYRQKG